MTAECCSRGLFCISRSIAHACHEGTAVALRGGMNSGLEPVIDCPMAGGATRGLARGPRERILLFGAGAVSDADLLAILLGTGSAGESSPELAMAILRENGGLALLAQKDAAEMAERRGLGPAKAARIVAALELGRRSCQAIADHDRNVIDSLEAVEAWARPRLTCLEHEEVWILGLDGRNRLKAARRVGQGGLHGCSLLASDILRPAVKTGASALVLVHNHPSGDSAPSEADVTMTRALATACDIVGIALLDHVVVARSGLSSLRELGLFAAASVSPR